MRQKSERGRALCFALSLALAFCACACAAASRPPDATGPRASEPVYATITDSAARREAVLTAWANLTRSEGINNAPQPELQPITQTLKSIPPTSPPLYLPKVGAEPVMTEEETRESLRRFIADQSTLIGADPPQLSLVLRTDLADGTKKAQYQQHPFRYPLRGGYGQLEISFTPDRRILQINSTCIPDVDQLQRTRVGPTPRLNAEQVAANLVGRSFTYTDTSGNQQTYAVAKGDKINVRELVIYPLVRTGEQPALDLHRAWEVVIGEGSAALTIYFDTLTNKIIAASATPQT
ncbi:MAG TPA: hypothetical protein VF766_15255 [Pyrinomonadaceae bacterium]